MPTVYKTIQNRLMALLDSDTYVPAGYLIDPATGAPASLGGGGTDATAANQATEIARLESILAKIIAAPATAANQAAIAALLAAATPAGENHLGAVGGHTPRVTGQLVRAADATGAYTAGDLIGQSTTGATNTPIEFDCARIDGGSGFLGSARCTLSAGSGTIVIALAAFDLLLFRPTADIPFAAASYPADNAACNISAAAMKDLVGIFSFSAASWRNQLGANAAAGDHVCQTANLGGVGEARTVTPFNLASLGATKKLRGIIQAVGAWNPGNVAQTFDFVLDESQN